METSTGEEMKTGETAPTPQEELSRLFGSYKAEWLREQMFDLFTEPAYFPELTAPRPCMLIGGRGTGKTTVLRCLSYEGQFALRGKKPEEIPTWPYYGLYYRVNTNRVTAFSGSEVTEEKWIRLFAHYVNLIFCDLVLRFLQWYQLNCPDQPRLKEPDCIAVAASLGLDKKEATDSKLLSEAISRSLLSFEAVVNNIADSPAVSLSMQGAPIDVLMLAIQTLPNFKDKSFFFLLDEYENFLDYQQQVLNTLIKHSGQIYNFKIGIRELGWRRRTTLNPVEQLIHPSDYVRINIVEKLGGDVFNDFAKAVCNSRVSRITSGAVPDDVKKFLPGLTEEEEAVLLDESGDGRAKKADQELEKALTPADQQLYRETPLLMRYLLHTEAEKRNRGLREIWIDYTNNKQAWVERYENYKYSLLFTLRKGRRGIQKYYCGWKTFTQIAGTNIRYLLELVDQSLLLHLRAGGTFTQPVDVATQTTAAQEVGRKNLSELEGLSVHGAQLTKLLLGLGRVFQTLASDPIGHTPEANQFHLSDSTQASGSPQEDVERLLTAAVMHLALLRFPGNKLADEGDTRAYDYMIHPVYAAFFVFSHRRKRKIQLSEDQILGLVRRPKQTIRDILAANNRSEEQLPEQLLLFEKYYDAIS